jgi:hypothetical protein
VPQKKQDQSANPAEKPQFTIPWTRRTDPSAMAIARIPQPPVAWPFPTLPKRP